MDINVDDGYTPNRYARFKRQSPPSTQPKTMESQGWAGTSPLGEEDYKEKLKNMLAMQEQKNQLNSHISPQNLGQFMDVFV
jgi:hypothetical protein